VRLQFIDSLLSHSKRDDSTFLVVGDLGFGVVEKFAQQYPERFLNAGVAEQNMLGMAAGIASTSKLVFAYSIANFPSMRALEQVRNDVCHHSLPVVVASVGAGLGYGSLGYSHHAVEDIAVMRPMPGLTVYSPADDFEVQACFDDIVTRRKPAYLRLGKGGEKAVHTDPLQNGAAPARLTGGDSQNIVLSHGAITSETAEALVRVRKETGVDCAHYSVPRLMRADLDELGLHTAERVITVEEHTTKGGFGSHVLEYLAATGSRPFARLIGLEELHHTEVGDRNHLLATNGLDPDGLAGKIVNFLSSGNR